LPVDEPDRRAGRSLLADRYRLGAVLGRGGAGVVYEALDITLGRPVAVKVFQADANAVSRYRFAAEARLLASLSHPGLVTIYDVCLDDDQPFLVLELVNGPTLRDLLDRGPFEPVVVARIGARLAEVLSYIHAHDVVHRDIKPSNVLIDEAGDCHLTDFGVARALSAAHLTASGEFVGTAAYLAPEQIVDADVGPGADIYALGLLLLECLTGIIEYTGTTIETAVARLHRPPRIPEDLPAPWGTLLATMTAQDPAARPDAARCAEVLRAIAQGRTAALDLPPAIPAPRRAEAGQSRFRPRPVHAGLTALAMAAVCAVAASVPTTIPGKPIGEPQVSDATTNTTTHTTGETAPPAVPAGTATPPAAAPQVRPPAPAPHPEAPPPKGKKDKPGKGKGKN
jgi:eukaryotic-like serine/threonine-protein kinase